MTFPDKRQGTKVSPPRGTTCAKRGKSETPGRAQEAEGSLPRARRVGVRSSGRRKADPHTTEDAVPFVESSMATCAFMRLTRAVTAAVYIKKGKMWTTKSSWRL